MLSRLSVGTRLLVLQVGVFGALLLLAGPLTYAVISRELQRDRDRYLTTMAASLADEYSSAARLPAGAAPPPRCLPDSVAPESPLPAATHRPRHLLVWDPEVGVVCSDGEDEPLAPAAARRASLSGEPAFAEVRWSAELMRLVEWPFQAPDGSLRVMEVGTSYRVIAGVLRKGLAFLAGLELVALALLVSGSWAITRSALGPIDRIIRQVEKIDEANLTDRLPDATRTDQVGRLVTVINRMLDRLARAFEAQSRFSSDAAHEIRSPLTALRGEIEVALRRPRDAAEYRRVLTECLEEVLRLSRLTEDLLSLARADAGVLDLHPVELDLRSLVRAVAGRLQGRADAKNVSLRIEAPGAVSIQGDLELLDRAVANLVDNAIIHSPRLGEIRIRVEAKPQRVAIVVEDDGPGIPPEHLERIFDRFYRVDSARSREGGGAGLGLPIVRQVVELHGGSVAVSSTPGAGSAFQILLPLTRRAPPR